MSEEENLYDRMKCCDNPKHESVEQENYSRNRFFEAYACENCKKTIRYYIRLLKYERYSASGEIEEEIPLTDEPLFEHEAIDSKKSWSKYR